MHAKALQLCPTLCDPMDSSPQASLSMGFSRQEQWSGLPFPSPRHTIKNFKSVLIPVAFVYCRPTWPKANQASTITYLPGTTEKVSLFFPWKLPVKITCKYLLMWEPSFPLLLFVFFNIIENLKKYIIFMYRSLWDWKFRHRRYWIRFIYQCFLKAIPQSATLILNYYMWHELNE